MKLSLLTYTIARSWSLTRVVDAARAFGFAGIEFRAEDGQGHGVEIERTTAERRDIRDQIADAYLDVAGIGTSSRFESPDPNERQKIVDRTKLLTGPREPTAENLRFPEVARIDLPEFMGAHTTFPLLAVEVADFRPAEKKVRDFLVIVNENNVTVCNEPRQMVYFVDITDEKRPLGVASYDALESSGNFCARGGRFGAHASHENASLDALSDARTLWPQRTRAMLKIAPALNSRVSTSPPRQGSVSSETVANSVGHHRS